MIDSSCWKLYISKLSEDVYVPVYLASRGKPIQNLMYYTQKPLLELWLCAREFQKRLGRWSNLKVMKIQHSTNFK